MAAFAAAFISAAAPAAAQDEVEQAQYSKEQCHNGRGDLAHCVDHGRDLFTGSGLQQDQPAALKLWRQVCDKDKTAIGARACSNVAIALTSSDVIPRDDKLALTYAERGCKLGGATGCQHVGFVYLKGEGTAINGPLAAEAFDKACGMRDGLSCVQAGWLYSDGELVPRDDVKAVSFHRQGCALDNKSGCASLGFLAQLGRGMPVDAALAVKLYKRACAAGIQSSCNNIEAIRGNGAGAVGYAELMAFETVERAFPPTLPVEQRYLLAKAAFDAGNTELALAGFNGLVEDGFGEAAFNLGRLYYEGGQGVAMDRPRAIRYFEQAANARHPYAMYILGEFNWYAINMDWNPDWGIAMMRGAAEAGLAEADPIWRRWQAERNAFFEERDAASRQMAIENERSQAAADAANMARIWGLYSSSQNQQGNGQVCGTIYRNNQAHHECMAKDTFDKYYNPNR